MTDARDAWGLYWAGSDSGACLPGAPTDVRAALENVWTDLADGLPNGARVLDVAAGGGAVLATLRARRADLELAGVDYAAVGTSAQALGVRGGVDAAVLPFADAAFDAVTSQFGLEYCRPEAWREAMRVLRPGGALRLVCHHGGSRAIAHNRARLMAMQALVDAGMFGLARDLAAGKPEDRVRAGRIAAARADHAAQPIVEELPRAIGQILARADRVPLLAGIERQAKAEMARLEAMSAAALDAAALAGRLALLDDAMARPLDGSDGQPIAWVISAR